MDDSTEGRYNMILGRDLITTMVLGIFFPDHVIIGNAVPHGGCSAPTGDVNNHDCKHLMDYF